MRLAEPPAPPLSAGWPDAVDELLPGGRAPCIDGGPALGGVVRAVHRLQREDIVGHIGLRISIGLVGVAARGRSTDIAAIAHDGVFAVVMRARHRDIGGAACLLTVLEAKGVAEFVQRSREIVIAELSQRIIVVGSEPHVAAGRVVAGVIGVGGRIGRRRLRDHDVGAVRPGVLDVGVGVAEDQSDRVIDRRLHLTRRRGKARGRRLTAAAAVGIGVVACSVRKAVGDRAGPFVARQQAVDLGVVGGTDGDSGSQGTLRSSKPRSIRGAAGDSSLRGKRLV